MPGWLSPYHTQLAVQIITETFSTLVIGRQQRQRDHFYILQKSHLSVPGASVTLLCSLAQALNIHVGLCIYQLPFVTRLTLAPIKVGTALLSFLHSFARLLSMRDVASCTYVLNLGTMAYPAYTMVF